MDDSFQFWTFLDLRISLPTDSNSCASTMRMSGYKTFSSEMSLFQKPKSIPANAFRTPE